MADPTIAVRGIGELGHARRPLDDHELARRLGVQPRQTINQVCRGNALAACAATPDPKAFNVGQKLYAGWIAGTVLVMMFTGLLMWFSGILRTISRTSVIFVHDYLALSILIVLAGHLTLAYRDPEARRGMRAGLVSCSWAKWEHPRWRYEDWPTAGIVTADLGNKGEPHMAGDDDISG